MSVCYDKEKLIIMYYKLFNTCKCVNTETHKCVIFTV